MIRIRNGVGMLALFFAAGCGCSDDSSVSPLTNPVVGPVITAGIRIPAIPVTATPERIDVLFVIDDSSSFLKFIAGTNPGRVKQEVARQIMKNLEDQILTDLQNDPRTAGKTFDIAFGVARYEDYGGPFRTSTNQAVLQSRPFVLQMPIFRKDRTGFLTKFDAALAAVTPGSGDPPSTSVPQPDASTAFEALYQAATGAGFDGNTNGSTTESGNPAQPGNGTAGTGYLTPGTSGDVPAVTWAADGLDDDQQPAFVAQQGGVQASGNLGGAGWREDAQHYVIMASDWAAVSPFDAPVSPQVTGQGTPAPSDALRSVPPVVTDPRFGSATTVAPTGRATVQDAIDALRAPGLDIEVLSIGFQLTANRGGKPNQPLPYVSIKIGPQVLGPGGALQVGEVFTGSVSGATGRIVNVAPNPATYDFLDYEPLTGFFLNAETITGATSGATATTQAEPQYGRFPEGPVGAVTAPTFLRPSASDYGDPGPFTWMSIVAHLTGAYDTTFPAAADNMPLVYNLLTVYPTGSAQPTADVREDLVDRIVANSTGGGGGSDTSDIPVNVQITVGSVGGVDYVFSLSPPNPTIPTPAGTNVSNQQTVMVHRYLVGTTPPADTIQRWVIEAAPETADPLSDLPGTAEIKITRLDVPSTITARVDFLTHKASDPVVNADANVASVLVPSTDCFLFRAVPPTQSTSGNSEVPFCANFP